jgi:hypothetical protein
MNHNRAAFLVAVAAISLVMVLAAIATFASA